jgi:hypothetical protein
MDTLGKFCLATVHPATKQKRTENMHKKNGSDCHCAAQ